jgi:hypothetical protein
MAKTPEKRNGLPSRMDPSSPLSDPAEAVERIVPRRRLKLEDGDIVIVRTSGGFRSGGRDVFQLYVRGQIVARAERFTGFDRAAATGEQLATTKRVRLFYLDSENSPPHLLSDFRDA